MGKSVLGLPDDPRLRELIRRRKLQVERERSKLKIRDLTLEEYAEEVRQEVARVLQAELRKPREQRVRERVEWLESPIPRKMFKLKPHPWQAEARKRLKKKSDG